MFSADKCHMHHILREFFSRDTRKTVLFIGVLQGVFTLTGMQMQKHIDQGVLLLLFVLNVVMLYMALDAMIKRQKRKC